MGFIRYLGKWALILLSIVAALFGIMFLSLNDYEIVVVAIFVLIWGTIAFLILKKIYETLAENAGFIREYGIYFAILVGIIVGVVVASDSLGQSTLVATGHIIGSIVSMLASSVLFIYIGNRLGDAAALRLRESAALALRVNPDSLDSDEHFERLISYYSKTYSSDRVANRLSDAMGVVRTIWVWVSELAQLCIIVGVIWFSVSESPANAVYAWFAVAVSIAASIIRLLFTFLCKLLTGSFPGQPKTMRKTVLKHMKTKDESVLLNDVID